MAQLVETIAKLDAKLASLQSSVSSIASLGLVPTMGAFHAGHKALIERAQLECEHVVVSIFVNPLQFDQKDDLQRYPRTLKTDFEVCQQLDVDIVFAPSTDQMYPSKTTTRIGIGPLGDHLCGASRQGHFEGVAIVIAKLFNIVHAQRAYFGEKDAQQLAIIRRMVADLNLSTTIVGVPTIREADGLAMSSRNQHLNPAERQQAPALYHALREAERLIEAGTTEPDHIIAQALRQVPPGAGLRVEYLEIVDPEELQPVKRIDSSVLVAGALWVGRTRLIDNVFCKRIRKQL
jgi:pantoate--beta-alanine ligase